MDAARDWQAQSIGGLRRLQVDWMPAMEIVFLDALAAHLMGPEAPEPPYTIEQGTVVVQHLLRAVTSSQAGLEGLEHEEPPVGDALEVGRQAVVDGAHRFAMRGGPGVQQLVTRYLGAAVGELEMNTGAPDAQVRSLFYFGLLAIASGPENQLSQDAADSCLAIFRWWDDRIGQGFVPPWRVLSP